MLREDGKMRETDIIDAYAQSFVVKDLSYSLMSMMLDHDYLHRHMMDFGICRLYIFGGGPLGVQLYENTKDEFDVCGFIEEDGALYRNACYGWGYRIPNMKVFSLDEFRRAYNSEHIVLSNLTNLEKDKKTIEEYVEESKIIYINELVYGGVNNAIYR